MNKKNIAFIVISIFICLLVYLPPPKGIEPQDYHPTQPTNLDVIETPKNKLEKAKYIDTTAVGVEDIQISSNGLAYSGLQDGTIIEIKTENFQTKVIAKSEGPIFGIDINSKGDLIALADQVSGIKIYDIKNEKFQYVVSEYKGQKFLSPNAVVFGKNDQMIYFTVSSKNIRMAQFHEMLLYSEGSGRIFGYNLKQKTIQLLVENLYFVNGLQYSSEDNCLYFVQTSRSRLMKFDLQGQEKGKVSTILENILGYPDNVKLSSTGDLWVAIPALRDSFSNVIDKDSLIRRILLNLRIPLKFFLALSNVKYAGGIKVNRKSGEIVQYFFGEGKKIDFISGINEANGKLYLSSLTQNRIAVVDLDLEGKVKEQEKSVIDLEKKGDQNSQKKAEEKSKSQIIQISSQQLGISETIVVSQQKVIKTEDPSQKIGDLPSVQKQSLSFNQKVTFDKKEGQGLEKQVEKQADENCKQEKVYDIDPKNSTEQASIDQVQTIEPEISASNREEKIQVNNATEKKQPEVQKVKQYTSKLQQTKLNKKNQNSHSHHATRQDSQQNSQYNSPQKGQQKDQQKSQQKNYQKGQSNNRQPSQNLYKGQQKQKNAQTSFASKKTESSNGKYTNQKGKGQKI